MLVAAAKDPALAVTGFALIGLGVAVIVPLAFTAAGNAGPDPTRQIAGVATITYGSGLLTPALVGAVAEATSLPTSFLLVAVVTVPMVLGAGALSRSRVVMPG